MGTSFDSASPDLGRQAVYDANWHPPVDGVAPNSIDAKRVLKHFLAMAAFSSSIKWILHNICPLVVKWDFSQKARLGWADSPCCRFGRLSL